MVLKFGLVTSVQLVKLSLTFNYVWINGFDSSHDNVLKESKPGRTVQASSFRVNSGSVLRTSCS